MIRLDIRCPAPPNRRGSWGDGAHLRSGIVTVDIHGLIADLGQTGTMCASPSMHQARGPNHPEVQQSARDSPTASVQWQKTILFFCRVPNKKSSTFLVIGPLLPEASDGDDGVLLPLLESRSATNPTTAIRVSIVTCRVPSVQARIRQPTIEGLQFFADDITHWLDGAFGDGSAPKPRDDLKMIGSRFFGSKGSSSASSSTVEDDEDDPMAATILRLIVSEADVVLEVPRRSATHDRVLGLRASDLDAKVELNTKGSQETVFAIAIMDATFADRTDPSAPLRIFGRTTPLTLMTHNNPILHFRFSSQTDLVTTTRETSIKLVLSSATVFVTKDISWIKELALFAKTPEGVFEDVVPSEVTRISVQLYDCSVHAAAPTLLGALVAVLGVVDVKAVLVSDAEERIVELGLSSSYLLAVDDLAAVIPLETGHAASVEAWKSAGFACLAELGALEAQLARTVEAVEEAIFDVLQCQLRITACADSLATVGALVEDFGRLLAAKDDSTRGADTPPETADINVFGSVDEDAFNRLPDVISGADLIDDDLPTNLDYIDEAIKTSVKSSRKDPLNGEGLRSWYAGDTDAKLASEASGETIKILYNEPFELEEGYWASLPVVTAGYGDE